jgi:single-strand DNA-binding protein
MRVVSGLEARAALGVSARPARQMAVSTAVLPSGQTCYTSAFVGRGVARERTDRMASGSVNKVILVGNLGRDAELRATPGGLEVISFSVATTERKRDRETNQWTDQVEWHRVKMFRDTNKSRSTVHEYLKKGQKVYVEGRLQTRSWDDKDGQKKYSTEIISDRIELLGRKEGGSGGGGGRERDDDDGGYQGGGGYGGGSGGPQHEAPDDDVPF